MKEVTLAIEQIKKIRTRDTVCNLFIAGKKLEEFLSDDSVKISSNDDVVLIKKSTDYCTRLYFFARNKESMSRIPALISDDDTRPIMIDIIGKDGKPEEYSEFLQNFGFSHYITYGKWSGNRDTLILPMDYTDQPLWDEPVRLAKIEDLDRVYNLLYDTFDKLAYELQDRETLAQQILNNEVYVTGIKGKVVAFFIALRPSEKVCAMDYLAVDKNIRGKGMGLYICGYVLQRLPHDTKINYYASITNTVTGRKKGLFGMTKENFSKILLKYDN